jgi:hypothetical protein
VALGRSWLSGCDRVLFESETGPGWACLNYGDVTKWSNGGCLRGIQVTVGAMCWAWCDHGGVTRALRGVTAVLAVGLDAVGVGPKYGRGP